MKHFLLLLLSASIFISCRNEEAQRVAAEKEAKKSEAVFTRISSVWNFTNPPLGSKSRAVVGNWVELRIFTTELLQKPRTSIGAFRKKAKTLSTRVADLNKNIPPQFNRPEIRSRIAVLSTKINSINLFINLQDIPADKVVTLVNDTNIVLGSLYRQMDELTRRSEIRKEEGETDMLRMLDTTRAIPDKPKPVPPPILNLPLSH